LSFAEWLRRGYFPAPTQEGVTDKDIRDATTKAGTGLIEGDRRRRLDAEDPDPCGQVRQASAGCGDAGDGADGRGECDVDEVSGIRAAGLLSDGPRVQEIESGTGRCRRQALTQF